MKQRSELLPKIAFDETAITSEFELFQNQVLRPILKFQSEMCCSLTIGVCMSLAPDFMELNTRKREQLIGKVLQGDQPLRNQLLGIVLGMMETEQLNYFISNRKELTKRIYAMLAKRILDQYTSIVPARKKAQED